MNTRRKLTLLIAAIAALSAFVGFTGTTTAAKTPTYFVYKQCSSATLCKSAVYTQGNKIVTLQIGAQCTDSRVTLSGSSQTPVKFSKKTGKFKLTTETRSYSYATGEVINGTMEVSGKVSKKKKVSGTYKVDKAVSECAGVLSGKFSAKYKGTQKGG